MKFVFINKLTRAVNGLADKFNKDLLPNELEAVEITEEQYEEYNKLIKSGIKCLLFEVDKGFKIDKDREDLLVKAIEKKNKERRLLSLYQEATKAKILGKDEEYKKIKDKYDKELIN